jgi:internalin A
MSKLLFKVAKELNYSTNNIVGMLNKFDYLVENKPNAKITDEMYDILLNRTNDSSYNKKDKDTLFLKLGECKATMSESLDLKNLKLSVIPSGLANFTWVKTLILNNNNILKIQNLEKLSDLTTLYLSNNKIEKIDNLFSLVKLKNLWLTDNKISKIEGIDKLKNLKVFGISTNKINKLEGFENLPNLEKIYAAGNQIKKLEGVNHLVKLDWLDLASNLIDSIDKIDNLESIKSICLQNNKIENLEPLLPIIKRGIKIDWVEYDGKDSIKTLNNPLQIPDIETVMRGNQAILAYFEEREKRKNAFRVTKTPLTLKDVYESVGGEYSKDGDIIESQPKPKIKLKSNYSNTPSVKMILFGNSGAGKTNLSKYLRTNAFDENDRDSTHGILIENWTKPDGENILAHIWDFGGQEYYHGAYRLFMTHKTVFILLWEQETNQNFGDKRTLIKNDNGIETHENIAHFELQYWLDNIAHFAPNSPIFVVQNKIDAPDNSKHRHLPELFEHYSIEDDFAVSLKLGSKEANVKEYRNLQHFKKELIETLKLHTYDDQTQTRLKLRDLLIDLQEEKTEMTNPFLSYKDKLTISVNDFEAIMRTIVVDIQLSNAREVLDWLHTRGIILFYKDNPTLNDSVFLQPKKIIDLIYAVLNKNVLAKEGQFNLQDIDNQAIDSQKIIDFMLQMEIIFKVPNTENKNEYIAPQYLPESHALQDLYEIASEEINNSSFSVKLPLFYYRRVMQQLILHYGKNQDANCKAYFWKHGILIKKDGIRLLIKGLYPNENESEGIISVATDKKEDFLKLQKEVFKEIVSIVNGWVRIEIPNSIYENYDGPGEDITDKIWKEDIEKNPGKYAFSTTEEELENVQRTFDRISKKEQKTRKRIKVSRDGNYFVKYSDLIQKAKEGELRIEGEEKTDKTKTKSLKIIDFQMILDTKVKRPLKVFISYAHKDRALFEVFKEELNDWKISLGYEEIEIFEDTKLVVGEPWDEQLKKELNHCDLGVLLVSQPFLNSKYIKNEEFGIMKQRKDNNEMVLFPIYFSPCSFSNWEDLANLQLHKESGEHYGHPNLKDKMSYADLIDWFPNGSVKQNPHRDRYMQNMVEKIKNYLSNLNQK